MDGSVESSISDYRHDRVVTGRIGVVSGRTGRRRWTDEVKGRIVAESYAGEVSVSAVARRHGIVSSQLFTWWRQAREGKLALPVDDDGPFVPLLLEDAAAPPTLARGAGPLEIEAGGVTVRLSLETTAARIAEIVRALREAS